jgi:TRAP-type mannitol/chloroaromatic compound transport system permease large subunit
MGYDPEIFGPAPGIDPGGYGNDPWRRSHPYGSSLSGGFWCPAPNWTVLKESGYATLKTTSMVMMLFIGGKFFSALFYFKGVAPPEFTMMHIYRGIIPFVLLQLFSIALLCLFPSLVT